MQPASGRTDINTGDAVILKMFIQKALNELMSIGVMVLSHARPSACDLREKTALFKNRRRRTQRTPRSPEEKRPVAVNGATVFERNVDVVSRRLPGGETVLFHLGARTTLVLNATAARVFAATDGTNDVRGVAKIMGDQYNTGYDLVFDDVKCIYKNFFDRGVVIHGG